MIGEPASTKNRPNAKASAMAIAKEKQRKRSYDRGIRAERWAGWLMRAKGFQIMKCRYKAQGGGNRSDLSQGRSVGLCGSQISRIN